MQAASTYIFILLVSVLSCNTPKDLGNSEIGSSDGPTETESTLIEEGQYTYGTITTAYEMDGCPYLVHLQAPLEDDTEFLLPIGLNDRFLVHDMKLKFTFLPSRAPSGNCYIGMPAVLSNVSSL